MLGHSAVSDQCVPHQMDTIVPKGTAANPSYVIQSIAAMLLPCGAGVALGYGTGLFGNEELVGIIIGTLFAWLAYRNRWMILGATGVLASMAAVALCQPAYRGSHRWITLFGDVHWNVALPLMAVAAIGMTGFRKTSALSIVVGTCTISLLLIKAFTVVGLVLCSGQPLWTSLWRSRWRGVVVLLPVLLGIAILREENRRERLIEYWTQSSYHSRQIRRSLFEIKWFGPPEGTEVRVPAVRTDLALLHVARTRGAFFAILEIACFIPFVQLGLKGGLFGSSAACRLILCAFVGHCAVCMSILPTVGMPAPFIGAGGTQWMSFAILLTWLLMEEGFLVANKASPTHQRNSSL